MNPINPPHETNETNEIDQTNQMNQPNRTVIFLSWLPVVLYMAFIFALSSQSSLPSLYEFTGADKLSHVVAYAPLGLLIAYALSRSVPKASLLFLASILALLYGLTDEIHHYFVPGRSASGLDLMADGFGALIGSSIFTLLHEAEKVPPVKVGMSEGCTVALAKEDTLRRVAPDEAQWRGPRL